MLQGSGLAHFFVEYSACSRGVFFIHLGRIARILLELHPPESPSGFQELHSLHKAFRTIFGGGCLFLRTYFKTCFRAERRGFGDGKRAGGRGILKYFESEAMLYSPNPRLAAPE